MSGRNEECQYICKMFLFYSYKTDFKTAFFDEVETRHCIQVLRKQIGDEIYFTDGHGHLFRGQINKISKKEFTCQILQSEEKKNTVNANLHIAIAPPKNIDRFEWFLEKATEIGISEVTPLICENSERRKIRIDRMEKIIISAMKQSLNYHLPKLNAPTLFQGFMDNLATEPHGQRFIAHCRSAELPHLFNNYKKGSDVVLLIGPEGDFSLDEISMAVEAGIEEISLGKSRMRTETAALAGVHILNLKSTI